MVSIQQVVQTIVFVIVVGAIFWLLNWLVDYCVTQDPYRRFAKGFLAVCGVLILIGILLSFIGYPLIRMAP